MAQTDTNGDSPRKTRRTGFTKVVMLNASGTPVLTAKGEPSDDPTEATSFTIQVGSMEPVHCKPFDFAEKIRNGLVIFGAKQRFTNAIGGLPEDEAVEKIVQIHEQMVEGEDWARTGEGPRIGLLVEAAVLVSAERGEPRDAEDLRAKLKVKDATWLKDFAKNEDIAAAMLQIKAKKAVAAAEAAKAAKPSPKQTDFAAL